MEEIRFSITQTGATECNPCDPVHATAANERLQRIVNLLGEIHDNPTDINGWRPIQLAIQQVIAAHYDPRTPYGFPDSLSYLLEQLGYALTSADEMELSCREYRKRLEQIISETRTSRG